MKDRFGLGWRPELAAGILANLDRIDVVEVIADDCFEAPPPAYGAPRPRPRTSDPAPRRGARRRIDDGDRSARPRRWPSQSMLWQPEAWSEHLAFVRAGGIEIGHLAAPPRTPATVEGTARNFDTAARITGATPLVENVASLIDPPGSTLDEAAWLTAILDAMPCDLLLDLHNLHANACNSGSTRPRSSPGCRRIGSGHSPGGRKAGGRTILDDHQHDVPDPVFELLVAVGRRVPGPLTVILERDGAYPPMASLLAEMESGPGGAGARPGGVRMSRPEFEAFLARLYTNDRVPGRVPDRPAAVARDAALNESEVAALGAINREGLALAANSFAHKHAAKKRNEDR